MENNLKPTEYLELERRGSHSPLLTTTTTTTMSPSGNFCVCFNESLCPENTTCSNSSLNNKPEYGNTDISYLKYTILAFYLMTFAFGIFGNSLTIYIIGRFSQVRVKSVANYYIWNLAFADECFILTLPLFCYASYTRDWVFGDIACRVAFVMKETNKFTSIFTIVALTVDRFLASYHNMSALRMLWVGKVVCVCIWVSGLISTIPYWLYSSTMAVGGGRTSCRLTWPIDSQLAHRRAWTYFQLSFGLILPFSVICLSYILLLKRLRDLIKPRQSSQIKRPSRRMTKTVLAVFVIFLLCHVPYYTMELISLAIEERKVLHQRVPTQREAYLFVHFNAVAQILVFINSCCNPILYGIYNENYRKLYKEALGCSGDQANIHDSMESESNYIQVGSKTILRLPWSKKSSRRETDQNGKLIKAQVMEPVVANTGQITTNL